MEYLGDDRRLFGEDRRQPRRVRHFLKFWGAVLATVFAFYGGTFLVLSIERNVAPEPKVAAEPAAEKLQMPRSFVISCDATMTSRGALEKWTPPECYLRPEPLVTKTKVSR